MSPYGPAAGQFISLLVTFVLISIPFAILNTYIARRKGRSGAVYGWLSVIPMVGQLLAVYLLSLTDKELLDKVDRILEQMGNGSVSH